MNPKSGIHLLYFSGLHLSTRILSEHGRRRAAVSCTTNRTRPTGGRTRTKSDSESSGVGAGCVCSNLYLSPSASSARAPIFARTQGGKEWYVVCALQFDCSTKREANSTAVPISMWCGRQSAVTLRQYFQRVHSCLQMDQARFICGLDGSGPPTTSKWASIRLSVRSRLYKYCFKGTMFRAVSSNEPS